MQFHPVRLHGMTGGKDVHCPVQVFRSEGKGILSEAGSKFRCTEVDTATCRVLPVRLPAARNLPESDLKYPIAQPSIASSLSHDSDRTRCIVMAPPFGPGCDDAYKKVFSDDSPESWCWLGYEGNSLVPAGQGTGDLKEMVKQCTETVILFGFLRLHRTDGGGDSKRVKFVFITWVGESASPLKKGKVTIHKKMCADLFKGYHIEKQLYEMDALKNLEEEIDAALLSAGGANYDLGNSRSGVKGGNSDALKAESANFFKKKEQESQIKNIVYDKGPLAKGITACDLGGRSTVAPASEAKKNTVGF